MMPMCSQSSKLLLNGVIMLLKKSRRAEKEKGLLLLEFPKQKPSIIFLFNSTVKFLFEHGLISDDRFWTDRIDVRHQNILPA